MVMMSTTLHQSLQCQLEGNEYVCAPTAMCDGWFGFHAMLSKELDRLMTADEPAGWSATTP